MNFFDYIGITKDRLIEDYIQTGLVNEQVHEIFPLSLFSYSRKCVAEQHWDTVTSKCRGIIVNHDTDEVIARPFEKFHNFGALEGFEPDVLSGQPVVWEKMDGFLSTAYKWKDKWYVASKGSFRSPQAKWATIEFNKKFRNIPEGYTPVFEGILPECRIVVDYGTRSELVLLALINIETGEELSPSALASTAWACEFTTPKKIDMTWQRAVQESTEEYTDKLGTDEGFVLTWYRKGMVPARLKVKYAEYFRLHRMVTGVSPKRIWEVLSKNDQNQLNEFLNESTPWFAKFAKKWTTRLIEEYGRIEHGAEMSYSVIQGVLTEQYKQTLELPVRKDWALMLQRPEFKEYAPIIFSKMDGKDIKPVIWRMVRHLTTGASAMVDAHNT